MGLRVFVKPSGDEIEVNAAPGVDEIAQREGWQEKCQQSEPNATGGAIALADANGIDLSKVTGSGDGGRVSKSDVQAYIEKK